MVANNLFSSTTSVTTSCLREASSEYRDDCDEEQVLSQRKIPMKEVVVKEWVTTQKPAANNLLAVECTLDEIIEEARRHEEKQQGTDNDASTNRKAATTIPENTRRRTHRLRQYSDVCDQKTGCCSHGRGGHPYASTHRVMLGRNPSGTGGFNGVGRYAPTTVVEQAPPRRCQPAEQVSNCNTCCSCRRGACSDAPASPQAQPPVIIQFQGFPGGSFPNIATPPPPNYYFNPAYNTGLDYGLMGQIPGWNPRGFATPPPQSLEPIAQRNGRSTSAGGSTTDSTRRPRSVESQQISSDVEIVRVRKDQKRRSTKKSAQAFFPMELIALDD